MTHQSVDAGVRLPSGVAIKKRSGTQGQFCVSPMQTTGSEHSR